VIEPQLAFQVAAALAVNCWVAPSLTVGFTGETVNASRLETPNSPGTQSKAPRRIDC
jgi:hypothetical protein